MLFSSMTFIFMFLPAVIALYFLVRSKYRNYVLLIASVLFYAWGEPVFVFTLVLFSFFNWLLSLAISSNSKKKKVFVSFLPDTEPNKGGYYCQVYADSEMEFELDNFTISRFELRGATDSLKLAYRIATERVKVMF